MHNLFLKGSVLFEILILALNLERGTRDSDAKTSTAQQQEGGSRVSQSRAGDVDQHMQVTEITETRSLFCTPTTSVPSC